jgi:hypothetical protein
VLRPLIQNYRYLAVKAPWTARVALVVKKIVEIIVGRAVGLA